jgi:hypothetical protein
LHVGAHHSWAIVQLHCVRVADARPIKESRNRKLHVGA